jgi:hypothetical protein
MRKNDEVIRKREEDEEIAEKKQSVLRTTPGGWGDHH